jgi:hypothetical protein
MKICNAVLALILYDQKKLVPRKTRLKSESGEIFLFIRVDTQLNWPRIIVEDQTKNELVWNNLDVKRRDLEIVENSITVETYPE